MIANLLGALFCTLNIFTQGFNELIVIAGTEERSQSALYGDMQAGLEQEAAPIIIHGSLIKQFLTKPAATSAKPISFPKDWHIFQHTGITKELFLLIPQKYLDHRKADLGASSNIETLVYGCGFNTKNLERIADTSQKNLVSILEASEAGASSFNFSKAFQQMLVSIQKQKPLTASAQKEAAQPKSEEMPWLFYWTGHGIAPEKLGAGMTAGRIKNEEKTLQSAASGLKSLNSSKTSWLNILKENDPTRIMVAAQIFSALNPGGPASTLFLILETEIPRLTELEKKLDTASKESAQSAGPQNTLADLKIKRKEIREGIEDAINRYKDKITSEFDHSISVLTQTIKKIQSLLKPTAASITGYIGGLPANEFLDVLTFLNTQLRVMFFSYTTCFSGGVNQLFVQDTLKKINVDFIVATHGIGEKVVYGPPTLDFESYFSLLRDYFGKPKFFVTKNRNGGKTNPLSTILSTVFANALTWQPNSQPFIFIPHIGVFQALKFDQEIFIVTHAVAQAATLDNKPINVSQCEAALIYPAYIKASIIIGNKTKLVLLTSRHKEISAEPFGATNLFDELSGQVSFGAFLANTSLGNTYFYKALLIKKFSAFSNIIFSLELSREHRDAVQFIDVLFVKEGKPYKVQQKFDRFDNYEALEQGDMEGAIQTALDKATELAQEQLIEFATKIVPPAIQTTASFESYKKNPSLAQLFDILATDLKQEAGIETQESAVKQRGLGELLLEGQKKKAQGLKAQAASK